MSLDYYAVIVLAAGGYIVARERIRFTTSALLLVSLWVLYGAGYFYYVIGSETWDHVSSRVTLALGVMWLGIMFGMELFRAFDVLAVRRQSVVMSSWNMSPITGDTDQRMAFLGWLLAAALLAEFVLDGRISQVTQFLSSTTE